MCNVSVYDMAKPCTAERMGKRKKKVELMDVRVAFVFLVLDLQTNSAVALRELHTGFSYGTFRSDFMLNACSILFLLGVHPFFDHTFGVSFPLPTPQERRAQQLKNRPECWIRELHEASTQGIEATSAKLFRTEWLWDAACCSARKC